MTRICVSRIWVKSAVWWVDDDVYQVVTATEVQARGRWVYDHPFFILLNVAVGGNYVGSPNDETQFPQAMLVDYVRVFSRERPE